MELKQFRPTWISDPGTRLQPCKTSNVLIG